MRIARFTIVYSGWIDGVPDDLDGDDAEPNDLIHELHHMIDAHFRPEGGSAEVYIDNKHIDVNLEENAETNNK